MVYFTQKNKRNGLSSSKTIGVLGGFGPETTAKFHLLFIQKFLRHSNVRPSMLIFNAPMPLELESHFIAGRGNKRRIIKLLVGGAKKLEQGGADFIIIPSNSMHLFINEVRQSVSIPVLSIIEETARFLNSKNISKIKILSTSVSRKEDLFTEKFSKQNVSTISISMKEQKIVDNIIQNILLLTATSGDKMQLQKIIRKDDIPTLLACTDLQNLVEQDVKNGIFDTMDILAEASVAFMTQ